jgi:spore maturation protein CgeB
MRTFEVPAIGACMLTEDTQEHREIFGEEGKAVVYFQTIPEMLEKADWLLNHEAERQSLAQNAHVLIFQGKHTYKDRLETMLSLTENLLLK